MRPRVLRRCCFLPIPLLALSSCHGTEDSLIADGGSRPPQDGAIASKDDGRTASDAPLPPTIDGGASGTAGSLDVLIVMQNSAAATTAARQRAFRAAVGALFEPLRALPGGLPDLHVGVISSDVGVGPMPIAGSPCNRVYGDQGLLQVRSGCGLQSGKYLASTNGGRAGNFTGKVEDVVGCLATLGDTGCGFEQFLDSMRFALGNPANAGFVRPEARLLILMIGDEDDCSCSGVIFHSGEYSGQERHLRCALNGHVCNNNVPMPAPSEVPLAMCVASTRLTEGSPGFANTLYAVRTYYDFLWGRNAQWRESKPPYLTYASAIAGWPRDLATAVYRVAELQLPQGPRLGVEPICQSSAGPARVGLRLKAFADAFAGHGRFDSICDEDLRPALRRIGEIVAADLVRAAGVNATVEPRGQVFWYRSDRIESHEFRITNTGRSPFAASVTVAGPNPRYFTITSDRCMGQMLAPGGSCAVWIRFVTPGGDVTAFLEVGSPAVASAALFGR